MLGLEGRRILVVEDEALIAMLIEDSLREAGARSSGVLGDNPFCYQSTRPMRCTAASTR